MQVQRSSKINVDKLAVPGYFCEKRKLLQIGRRTRSSTSGVHQTPKTPKPPDSVTRQSRHSESIALSILESMVPAEGIEPTA